MIGTSARDGLDAGNATFLEGRGRWAEDKLGGRSDIFRQTRNGQVFVIQGIIVQEYMSRLYARANT